MYNNITHEIHTEDFYANIIYAVCCSYITDYQHLIKKNKTKKANELLEEFRYSPWLASVSKDPDAFIERIKKGAKSKWV